MTKLYKPQLEALPGEIREALSKYESGQRLQTVSDEGLQEILAILRFDIEADEKKLLAFREPNPTELFGLLREIQGKRNQLVRLEQTVKARTALVQDPPPELSRYIPY